MLFFVPAGSDGGVPAPAFPGVLLCLAVAVFSPPLLAADQEAESFEALGVRYDREVRPLIGQFCQGCHSTALRTGELDLERFTDMAEVRRDAGAWVKVADMLERGEMPPEGSGQLQPGQEQALMDWVKGYLRAESLANAGDPGPVVLRRLNNAEYTYTVQDLTGVELDPTREFPTDSAAGEGFTNAGNALVMSPGLLQKYLDAGKAIAQHAVLLPDGFRFFPSEDPAGLDRRDPGRDPPVLRPVHGGPEAGRGFGGGKRQRPRQLPHRAVRSPAAAAILCSHAGRAAGAALRPQDHPGRGPAIRAECQVPRQAVEQSQRSRPLSPDG